MSARRATAALLIALAFTASGCAVGRMITGEPAPDTVHARQALLVRRCSGCHAIPDPTTMSEQKWHASLERMKRRMRLAESEWDSLAAMPTALGGPPR